mmetsp:Transcript_33351/g.71990  ORF Transcript_33351/g.71990 Transcript_33351/m.71990 type:complete len:259 (-) Transcript_33351:333-1109(-)
MKEDVLPIARLVVCVEVVSARHPYCSSSSPCRRFSPSASRSLPLLLPGLLAVLALLRLLEKDLLVEILGTGDQGGPQLCVLPRPQGAGDGLARSHLGHRTHAVQGRGRHGAAPTLLRRIFAVLLSAPPLAPGQVPVLEHLNGQKHVLKILLALVVHTLDKQLVRVALQALHQPLHRGPVVRAEGELGKGEASAVLGCRNGCCGVVVRCVASAEAPAEAFASCQSAGVHDRENGVLSPGESCHLQLLAHLGGRHFGVAQ